MAMSILLMAGYMHTAAPGRPLSCRLLPFGHARSLRYYKWNALCRHFITEGDIYHFIRLALDFRLQLKFSRYFNQKHDRFNVKISYLSRRCMLSVLYIERFSRFLLFFYYRDTLFDINLIISKK